MIQRASALLVPVPEAEPVVGELRQRFDGSARRGVPAHITVLVPFVPPDGLGAIEDDLRDLFTDIPAFDYRLDRVARFPLLVYLAPEPSNLFTALTEAVVARFPGYAPYGGAFDQVIPHLTVAECETEGLCDDPEAVIGTVERAIVGGVPIYARAHEVWLMVGNGRWSLRRRFPLGG